MALTITAVRSNRISEVRQKDNAPYLCATQGNNGKQDSATTHKDSSDLLNEALLTLVSWQMLGYTICGLNDDCSASTEQHEVNLCVAIESNMAKEDLLQQGCSSIDAGTQHP